MSLEVRRVLGFRFSIRQDLTLKNWIILDPVVACYDPYSPGESQRFTFTFRLEARTTNFIVRVPWREGFGVASLGLGLIRVM